MALAFDDSDHFLTIEPLAQADKGAAILLAMGKQTSGRLLKYFTRSELQAIIASAQKLHAIPPDELDRFVAEFATLFTEGAGLIDSAKVIAHVLEDSLTLKDVDELLETRAAILAYRASVCERLKDADPRMIGHMLSREHPETAAYILSMLPPALGAKVLTELSQTRRVNIMNRATNLKRVSPKAVLIIEKRLERLFAEIDIARNSARSSDVDYEMNKLDKRIDDRLLQSLDTIKKDAAERVRPQLFLFDDILLMSQHCRERLLSDVALDVLTMALRATSATLKECVLNSLSPTYRSVVEAELLTGVDGIKPRDIALARRSIAQQALRLAASDQVQLRARSLEASPGA